MRRRTKNLGFTLIELILVLTILAIAATIATPTWRGFARGRQLPNTAVALMSTGRWCRVQAISDNFAYRLNFDLTKGVWWVTRDDGTLQNFQPVTESIGKEYAIPEGIALETTLGQAEDGAYYVTFLPNGQTDVCQITLKSEDNQATVVCDSPMAWFKITNDGRQK